MPDQGVRKVQKRGEVTLPQDFRRDNDIKEGEDHVRYRRHSRDGSKLVIEAIEEEVSDRS